MISFRNMTLSPLLPFHALDLHHVVVFQSLPAELIGMTFPFLRVLDQIRFALSCKYTDACFSSCLKLQKKQLSKLLLPELWPGQSLHATEGFPGTLPLLQLQNKC